MPIHDLKCEACGEIEVDAVVIYDRGISKCHCGGERKRSYDWGKLNKESRYAFEPIRFADTTFSTREEWEAYRRSYEQKNGKPLEVEGKSKSDHIQLLEDTAQHSITRIQRIVGRRDPEKAERMVKDLTNTYERNISRLKRGYT